MCFLVPYYIKALIKSSDQYLLHIQDAMGKIQCSRESSSFHSCKENNLQKKIARNYLGQ